MKECLILLIVVFIILRVFIDLQYAVLHIEMFKLLSSAMGQYL